MAGQVESLNVSVAAGVLLFEARRQRLQMSNKNNILQERIASATGWASLPVQSRM
jgi:hypothetical protein